MLSLLLCLSALGSLAGAVTVTVDTADIDISACPIKYMGSGPYSAFGVGFRPGSVAGSSFVIISFSTDYVEFPSVSGSLSLDYDIITDVTDANLATVLGQLETSFTRLLAASAVCAIKFSSTFRGPGELWIVSYSVDGTDQAAAYMSADLEANAVFTFYFNEDSVSTLSSGAAGAQTDNVDLTRCLVGPGDYKVGDLVGSDPDTCSTDTCQGSGASLSQSSCNAEQVCMGNDVCGVEHSCSIVANSVVDVIGETAVIPDFCAYKIVSGGGLTVIAKLRERRYTDTPFVDSVLITTPSGGSDYVTLIQGGKATLTDIAGTTDLTLSSTVTTEIGLNLYDNGDGLLASYTDATGIITEIFFEGTLLHVKQTVPSGQTVYSDGVCFDATDIATEKDGSESGTEQMNPPHTTEPEKIIAQESKNPGEKLGLWWSEECGERRRFEGYNFPRTCVNVANSRWKHVSCDQVNSDSRGDGITCSAKQTRCTDELNSVKVASVDAAPYITACADNLLCGYYDGDDLYCRFKQAYARAANLDSYDCSASLCLNHECASHEFCAVAVSGDAACFCRRNDIIIESYRTGNTYGADATCVGGIASVTLTGCLLVEEGVNLDDLHLNDDTCTAVSSTDNLLEFKYDTKNSCGATSTDAGDKIQLDNSIQNTIEGQITRENSVDIQFSCLFVKEMESASSFSFQIKDGSITLEYTAGDYTFPLTISLYSDDAMTEQLSANTELIINQKLYVKLEATDLGDSGLVLVINKCFTTTDDDAAGANVYSLIDNNCPSSTDGTVVITASGTDTYAAYEFNTYDYAEVSASDLFLHAVVSLCVEADGNCVTDCSSNGLP